VSNYGINLLKKNITKDNAAAAGSFMWNNSKLVGNLAMGAVSNMANKQNAQPQDAPNPPQTKN
jgi:hypothetical protein